jgi:hypothetical protein
VTRCFLGGAEEQRLVPTLKLFSLPLLARWPLWRN